MPWVNSMFLNCCTYNEILASLCGETVSWLYF